MSAHESPMRVLALIFPIEKHVGHWACSSSRLTLKRVIMSGADLEGDVARAIQVFRPQVIAVCGKAAGEYLDILDRLAVKMPEIEKIPRVFRMQNSSLRLQSAETIHSNKLCRDLSLWFRLADDPRWSWVFVQTLNDVEIVRRHLAPVPVSACPYGYDTAVFNPELPELDRTVDVGCYMNLRDHDGRRQLVARAEAICRRRGWSFRFVEGVYWHAYARQIRQSKISLHLSIHGEVPFRMYETTVFGTAFVTDPLGAGVETLFTKNREYVTYRQDFSDLEEVLAGLMTDPARRKSIGENGRARARAYAWPAVADRYVAPALASLLPSRESADLK